MLRNRLKLAPETVSAFGEILNHVPDDFFKNPNVRVLDPNVGGGDYLSIVTKRFRENHVDPNKVIYGIFEDVVDLNYAKNKNDLCGKFVVANFLDTIIGSKYDLIVMSPDMVAGISNSTKKWMFMFEKICDSLKPNGHAIVTIPSTWSSPSTERSIREKILTTLTTKFNLVEARFGVECPMTGKDALSIVYFTKNTYQRKSIINGQTVDLSGVEYVPFWLDKLPIHIKAQKELLAVPTGKRHIFTDKSTHGMMPNVLKKEKGRGCVTFPNVYGSNKPLYGKYPSTGVTKKMWDKARVGTPKLILSYYGEATITVDSRGKMGCMHNVRMSNIDFGYEPDFSRELFDYLKSLRNWNVSQNNPVEVKIMSLLIRHEKDMSEYLSDDVIEMIENFK